MAEVVIIIPTQNRRDLLEACLHSVFAQSHGSWRAVVVDNGSQDGTEEWVRASYPEVQLIRNHHNAGFAAAINQGVRATSSRWVALLNNDATPEADWLTHLLAACEGDPRIGAVASRMMFRDAPNVVNSAGIRIDRSAAPWDFLLGCSTWPEEPVEVFGASGGACLYRRAMLEDIGLLDESFFAYFEDVDLAWRARLRGWKAVLAPNALVYHAFSATGGEGSAFKRYYLARNKWRVIIKNYPTSTLIVDLPLIFAFDALAVAYSLARADLASIRGRLAVLRDLPVLMSQRSAIQARRTAKLGDLRRAMGPLEGPLTRLRRAVLVARLAGLHRL